MGQVIELHISREEYELIKYALLYAKRYLVNQHTDDIAVLENIVDRSRDYDRLGKKLRIQVESETSYLTEDKAGDWSRSCKKITSAARDTEAPSIDRS